MSRWALETTDIFPFTCQRCVPSQDCTQHNENDLKDKKFYTPTNTFYRTNYDAIVPRIRSFLLITALGSRKSEWNMKLEWWFVKRTREFWKVVTIINWDTKFSNKQRVWKSIPDLGVNTKGLCSKKSHAEVKGVSINRHYLYTVF